MDYHNQYDQRNYQHPPATQISGPSKATLYFTRGRDSDLIKLLARISSKISDVIIVRCHPVAQGQKLPNNLSTPALVVNNNALSGADNIVSLLNRIANNVSQRRPPDYGRRNQTNQHPKGILKNGGKKVKINEQNNTIHPINPRSKSKMMTPDEFEDWRTETVWNEENDEDDDENASYDYMNKAREYMDDMGKDTINPRDKSGFGRSKVNLQSLSDTQKDSLISSHSRDNITVDPVVLSSDEIMEDLYKYQVNAAWGRVK